MVDMTTTTRRPHEGDKRATRTFIFMEYCLPKGVVVFHTYTTTSPNFLANVARGERRGHRFYVGLCNTYLFLILEKYSEQAYKIKRERPSVNKLSHFELLCHRLRHEHPKKQFQTMHELCRHQYPPDAFFCALRDVRRAKLCACQVLGTYEIPTRRCPLGKQIFRWLKRVRVVYSDGGKRHQLCSNGTENLRIVLGRR